MLEPEDVDEGYFTPIASTTLSSLFRDDLGNEKSVNTSLKYKAQLPKKIDKCAKSDDPSATRLVYSCSLTAYEWVNGAHKCKNKVGFAIIRVINTGRCKIILYTPEKSTLSCTTVSTQLAVTLKGTMISLYDDYNKYWGICFNEKTVDEVTKLLQKENVIINNYDNVQSTYINNESSKADIDSVDVVDSIESEDISDETDRSSAAEESVSALNNERASILNRIANVGHAILPSTSISPVKKLDVVDRLNTKETLESSERLNVLDMSESSKPLAISDSDLTRSKAMQTNNIEHDNITNNTKQLGLQKHVASVPLMNNQVFAYVNGCMVPVHMPVLDNLECDISSTEIEIIVQKLTRLQGHLKTKEILKVNSNLQNIEKEKKCSCENRSNDVSKNNDSFSTNVSCDQNKENLEKISNLEELVGEKNEIIIKLQNEMKMMEQRNTDLIQNYNCSSTLKKEIEDLKQTLINKEKYLTNIIPKSEASSLVASTVKKLMNETFRSLASNFENEESYSGSNVKGILAAVIKNCTVETLSTLANPHDASNLPVGP